MTSILSEQIISLTQAAQRYDVNVSTIWRWRQRGVDGHRLETARLGGRRVTSIEALERFHSRVNGEQGHPTGSTAPSGRQRMTAIERAERELAEAGI